MYDLESQLDELNCLSNIDWSDDYSVDKAAICTDGIKFYFLTAHGCSCWQGEYYEEVYNSFEELVELIINEDVSEYAPSLKDLRLLITEAGRKLPNIKSTILDNNLELLDWLSINRKIII